MTVDTVRGVLLWSGIINYGFLILWVFLYFFARRWLHGLARWYRLSPENFDLVQFSGIVLYKCAIFFFNFIPYVALRMVG